MGTPSISERRQRVLGRSPASPAHVHQTTQIEKGAPARADYINLFNRVSISKMRIAFVRPGLGIGGAERLVVDAAVELDARGHEVTLFVGDRQEAQLDEVKAGRVKVITVGRKLPAHVAQRLRAPAAILRASWA